MNTGENFKHGLKTMVAFILVGFPYVFWKFIASEAFRVEFDSYRILMDLPFWLLGYKLFFENYIKPRQNPENEQKATT